MGPQASVPSGASGQTFCTGRAPPVATVHIGGCSIFASMFSRQLVMLPMTRVRMSAIAFQQSLIFLALENAWPDMPFTSPGPFGPPKRLMR